ncbi:MAG: hypothetical protein V4704_04665 [Pseudomonadota bacterium]
MRLRDIFIIGVFWIGLALASVAGGLGPIDGRMFDLVVRALPGASPSAVAVMRLDAPPPVGHASALLQVGATRVVDLDSDALQTLRPAHTFSAADAKHCRPPAGDGILRVLRLRDGDGKPCPLARLVADAGLPVPAGTLLSPDFSARTSTSIPRLDVRELAGSASQREAVAGRIVLRVPAPDTPAHMTPLYATDGLLEPSTPYAMVLDALVRGRAIGWAPAGTDVLVAALLILLLQLALRRSSYRRTLAMTLLVVVPVLLAYAATLHLGRLHVGPTASLVAIAVFALRTVLRRNRMLVDTLVEVDHRLTGLVGKPLGKGFELETEVVWEHANRFLTEFFDLRRSVMLELPTGATHLRPVAAFGCSAGDIIEKRRDYRRAPFSTALVRALPTAPSRPFLPAEDGVADLITPLLAADQLVGFWAFSVALAPGASSDPLAAEAARYANEVAKVILRVGRLNAPAAAKAKRWPTLTRLRARLLDGAMQAREQVAAYRDVFTSVGHPIAVFDLLGRLQLANPAFEEFADGTGQSLMAMSVTGMLESRCKLAPPAAKQVMRQALLGTGAEARVPMRARAGDIPQTLVLRPILRHAPDLAGLAVSPFDLLGMIVEIVPDASRAQAAQRLGHAAAQYARRSRATLEAIERTLDALGVDAGTQGDLKDILASGRSDASDLLHQAEGLPAQDPAATASASLDLEQVLLHVRQVLGRSAREKNVEIQLPRRAVPRVAASEESVTRFLRNLVALLLDDAAPGSIVDLTCSVSDGATVQLRITNDGFGMPAWHVQQVLGDMAKAPPGADASLLEQVAHAAASLNGNITFRLEPELGKGYRATLTLPRAI